MVASGAQATLTAVKGQPSWKPSPDVRMGGERDVIERRKIEFGLIKNQRPGNFAFGIEAYERGRSWPMPCSGFIRWVTVILGCWNSPSEV